jgi:hypothetical protein
VLFTVTETTPTTSTTRCEQRRSRAVCAVCLCPVAYMSCLPFACPSPRRAAIPAI